MSSRVIAFTVSSVVGWPNGCVGAVQDSREHAAGDRRPLVLRLLQRDEPLRALPFERSLRERRMLEQHVGEDRQRLLELRRRRDEADRAALAADPDRNVVPSCCSAFDSASPSRVVVPSSIIAAAKPATPALARPVSNWSAPPMKVMQNDTSGRSCFSETMNSAPLASAFVHAGTWSSGVGPGGGIFERSSACCPAATAARANTTARALRIARLLLDRVSPARRQTFRLSAGFDAISGLPIGTTLRMTRPCGEVLFATRLTSAA